MSGRSHSAACADFFERQAAAVEEGPDGAHARLDAALRDKPLLHLYDRHVRCLPDQTEQEVALRVKLGASWLALTARRSLTARAYPAHPNNRRGDPDLELGRHPPGRHPTERRIDHTITQVLAVSSRHGPPPFPKEQRTRTVRAIWESLQESEKPERALVFTVTPSPVMAGLVPAIHELLPFRKKKRGCPAQGRA
jgi:hypothetical protein